MKNNRAPGVCGIPAQLLKYGGAATLLWLQSLFSIVFRTEWIPKDWWVGIILPLWKWKGSCRICSNNRGHHPPLCAQEALRYNPPRPLYHFLQKPKTNSTGRLHARKVHRWANIHNAAADRKDSRISIKGVCCLCDFQGCFGFCRPAITLAHIENNGTTSEVLQPFWVAPRRDRELRASQWQTQLIFWNQYWSPSGVVLLPQNYLIASSTTSWLGP